MTDRYDPHGEAAIWLQAAELVMKLRRDDADTSWNVALEQAARVLDSEARGIRQRNGMYCRVISGQSAGRRPDQAKRSNDPIRSDAKEPVQKLGTTQFS